MDTERNKAVDSQESKYTINKLRKGNWEIRAIRYSSKRNSYLIVSPHIKAETKTVGNISDK